MVARSTSSHRAPPWARAIRRPGSTSTRRISRRSTTSAPSATAWPATVWPPPRTAIGSRARRPALTAATTSSVDRALDDRRRSPIDRPVERLSGSVVAIVFRPHDGPRDPIEAGQRIDCCHGRHDASFPIGVKMGGHMSKTCDLDRTGLIFAIAGCGHHARSRPSRPVRCTADQSPRSQPRVPILPTLHGPADLRGLTQAQLEQLAGEIRETIISTVATTGGHLGSSLGVVELTIALHRLLESPRDRIVWDTGHQAYPHKLLTGRFERFGTLRSVGGVGRFSAAVRIGARRLRRRARRDRPLDRSGSGDCAGPAPRARADRGRRRRRSDHERAQPRGAQRHRPAEDPAADRPQRQRDVDQPNCRRPVEVPQPDQAVGNLAVEQDRLRRARRPDPGRRPDRPRAEPAASGVGRQLRPAGTAVRGSRHHLHRARARSRHPGAPLDVQPGARAEGPGHRPCPDAEGSTASRRPRPTRLASTARRSRR